MKTIVAFYTRIFCEGRSRRTILLLIFFVSCGLPTLAYGQFEPIVYILATPKEGGSSTGTGFFIGPQEVATCYHVIEGAVRLQVWDNPKGGPHEYDSSRGDLEVVTIAPDYDLAVLRLKGVVRPPSVLPLEGDANFFQAGDAVEVLGHPQRDANNLIRGEIPREGFEQTQLWRDREDNPIFAVRDIDLLKIDLTSARGMSGGPVVHGGRTIGVFAGSISSDPVRTFGWAIPIKYLVGRGGDKAFEPVAKCPELILEWPPLRMISDPKLRKNVRHPLLQPIAPLFYGAENSPGAKFVGRTQELQELDRAWEHMQQGLVGVVGLGGLGETMLVRRWLQLHGFDTSDPKEQGVIWFTIQSEADLEAFFRESIKQLTGIAPTPEDLEHPADQLTMLQKAVGSRKCLFVLDGLDNLQETKDQQRVGRASPVLAELLRWFCELRFGNSLCVAISRVKLTDVDTYKGKSYREIVLQEYSLDEALQVLRIEGVTKGSKSDLMRLADEVCGRHDLALRLAANLLQEWGDGDASRWREFESDKPLENGPLETVFASFERTLKNQPIAMKLMVAISLFREPVDPSWLVTLGRKGTQEGDSALSWPNLEMYRDLDLLIKINLLDRDSSSGRLIPHRLVAEHFRDGVKAEEGLRLQAALFSLYKDSIATKLLPDTADEMRPLYEAVYHGCVAGKHIDAMRDVYLRRIVRGDKNLEENQYFNTRTLRAYTSDLETLSHFFLSPWTEAKLGFTVKEEAELTHAAALDLFNLGRLRESVAPFRHALDAAVREEDWLDSFVSAGTLGMAYVYMGKMAEAEEAGRKGIEYADKLPDNKEDRWYQFSSLSALAFVLHMEGRNKEARQEFEAAEKRQKIEAPGRKYLFGLRGYWYGEFLTDQGEYDAVIERSLENRKIHEGRKEWTLFATLDDLNAGLALSRRGRTGDAAMALPLLNQAVEGTRHEEAIYFSLALLARSEFYRRQGKLTLAQLDLSEADTIVSLADSELLKIDLNIQQAWLRVREGKWPAAASLIASIDSSVRQIGYDRRAEEVTALKAQLAKVRAIKN